MIDSFRGEYRFLSNFHACTIDYEGITYPTTEHAYQAAKSVYQDERKHIAQLVKPGDAKREGQKLTLRPDWEKVKLQVMEEIVRQKFTRHPDLQAKLLATGNEELIEGNNWGDTFYGVYNGKGENHLGKILMKVRLELRDYISNNKSN